MLGARGRNQDQFFSQTNIHKRTLKRADNEYPTG